VRISPFKRPTTRSRQTTCRRRGAAELEEASQASDIPDKALEVTTSRSRRCEAEELNKVEDGGAPSCTSWGAHRPWRALQRRARAQCRTRRRRWRLLMASCLVKIAAG